MGGNAQDGNSPDAPDVGTLGVSSDDGAPDAGTDMVESGPDAGTCSATQLTCDGGCVSTATDSNNCGRCGHSCAGGAWTGAKCQPLPLAFQAPFASALAIDGTNVYCTESTDSSQADSSGAVEIALLSGVNTSSPTPLAGNQAYPTGIGVNSTGAYWINAGDQFHTGRGDVASCQRDYPDEACGHILKSCRDGSHGDRPLLG
jgi:hypothetical protein